MPSAHRSAASTPAVALLIAQKVEHSVHTYDHDPRSESFGTEAADVLTERLGVVADQIFKTLVIKRSDNTLAVAVLPVTATLSLKAAASALGTRKIVLADRAEAEKSTGYVFGGISPLGQKRALATVVDESALAWDRILCSGGRRGFEIELDPKDLVRLARAVTAPVAAS
ncbi:Cys-tRNA(Pro) deacylase [Rhodococcus sp. 14-2470-1b]|jgi:Cys-tRNA(Pro)/Cys-tRNA(Cys) deacylase|uniref:Cys-tRNA(Pro) deacylase n=1 Tax=unclassified Rhodococcus (in: high G+C Gram-positive bacteria) TaxID=192944 RepID=UPI000B9AD210|nr:Cys-tRNA(Pro) deacylase [Rhodococcus sp. 14-2470-1b]OZF58572.1 Cys-tRNA(Pro) deacylase [Rhodococcus sp. 14-2470-1b]